MYNVEQLVVSLVEVAVKLIVCYTSISRFYDLVLSAVEIHGRGLSLIASPRRVCQRLTISASSRRP